MYVNIYIYISLLSCMYTCAYMMYMFVSFVKERGNLKADICVCNWCIVLQCYVYNYNCLYTYICIKKIYICRYIYIYIYACIYDMDICLSFLNFEYTKHIELLNCLWLCLHGTMHCSPYLHPCSESSEIPMREMPRNRSHSRSGLFKALGHVHGMIADF